jgi:hypothetical protein
MAGKDMNSAMLLDSGEFLVIYEHPIHAPTFPASSKICVEQRFATIYQERSADFQITLECLRAVICDKD